MAGHVPRVSFAVPVRNGADSIARCLDSILRQDFSDFEVIVSDNASTDRTCEIVREYARREARIRLIARDENIGLLENFNHVAREARGEYFRWVGADDWLEPSYASECVAALDARPDAIVATSYFDLELPGGDALYREHHGEFLDQPTAVARLAHMLGFFHAGAALYEPSYALMRREVLVATGLLRIHRKADWLLSTQLSLIGPFVHVPKRLFHRWFPYSDEAGLAARLHPVWRPSLEPSTRQLLRGMLDVVDHADLGLGERWACRGLILRFAAGETFRVSRNALRRFRRDTLGLTRARFDR